jgi:hypothetical protein
MAEYDWKYLDLKMICKLVASFGVDYIKFSFISIFLFLFYRFLEGFIKKYFFFFSFFSSAAGP